MLKPFYASGFLYNIKTHQILLLQSEQEGDTTPSYSMLGGNSNKGEEAQITFQRTINKLLSLNLKIKDIYPVYNYFHQTKGKINYVFYAEIKKFPVFKSAKKKTLVWVTFDKTLKLSFSANTRQDVIVGERVINLKRRLTQSQQ